MNIVMWAVRSVRKHGVLGIFGVAGRKVWKSVSPGVRRQLKQFAEEERAFDEKHHVDTGGIVSLSKLAIPSENWEKCLHYEGIPEREFRSLMQAAAPLPAGSTFIDFGCGKGRAVLLAGEYPFRAVVGVEFSPELAETARTNIQNCKGFAHVCCNLEVVCMDAAQYEIPPGPLALYFYNPFMEEVMEAVIRRVRESLAQDPRPLVVIYATPTLDHLWAGVPGLRKTLSSRGCTIYRYEGTSKVNEERVLDTELSVS